MHFYLAQGLSEVDRGDFTPQHEEAEMQVFRAPVRPSSPGRSSTAG